MESLKNEKNRIRDLNALRPEDYLEPDCPLCMGSPGKPSNVTPVPQKRILDKLDSYMSRRDYEGAERHLLYWEQEAERGNDQRGLLLVCNELIGHFRKTGQRDKAFEYCGRALKLLEEMDFEDSISAGTTYVNCATAHSAFGEQEEALALFDRARAVYESASAVQPHLLGGLYNNMALAFQTLGRYTDAFQYYEKAMQQMAKVPGGFWNRRLPA